MSLAITGTDLSIIFFFLIGLNGYFIYHPKPLLGFIISGISVLFLVAFPIDYSGFTVILTLILMMFVIGDIIENWKNFK